MLQKYQHPRENWKGYEWIWMNIVNETVHARNDPISICSQNLDYWILQIIWIFALLLCKQDCVCVYPLSMCYINTHYWPLQRSRHRTGMQPYRSPWRAPKPLAIFKDWLAAIKQIWQSWAEEAWAVLLFALASACTTFTNEVYSSKN